MNDDGELRCVTCEPDAGVCMWPAYNVKDGILLEKKKNMHAYLIVELAQCDKVSSGSTSYAHCELFKWPSFHACCQYLCRHKHILCIHIQFGSLVRDGKMLIYVWSGSLSIGSIVERKLRFSLFFVYFEWQGNVPQTSSNVYGNCESIVCLYVCLCSYLASVDCLLFARYDRRRGYVRQPLPFVVNGDYVLRFYAWIDASALLAILYVWGCLRSYDLFKWRVGTVLDRKWCGYILLYNTT